jgi:hypothetical protein
LARSRNWIWILLLILASLAMLANFLAVRDMANLRSFCFYYGRPKHRVHISAIADQKALGGLRILERSIQVPQIAEKKMGSLSI